ncbi:MAG: hypothetical protein ACYDAD_11720 [Acidimicrobiales bacterium]
MTRPVVVLLAAAAALGLLGGCGRRPQGAAGQVPLTEARCH